MSKFEPYHPDSPTGGFLLFPGEQTEYKKYLAHIDHFLDEVGDEGLSAAVEKWPFDNIKDDKFQDLLKEFEKAGKALLEYAKSLNPDWEPK